MFKVPVTFAFDFEHVDDYARQFIFSSFAAAGAKHLVLTSTLIGAIFQRPGLTEVLQKEIANAGLTFVDSHAPYGREIDTNVMDPEYRKRAILRQQLAIATAAQFGVDTITVHVGDSNLWPGIPISEQHKNSVDFISKLIPTAEEYGVTVCIENSCLPFNTTAELNAILKAVDSKYLGLCYDAGHANVIRSECAAYYEKGIAWTMWREGGYDHVEWDDHILEEMLPNIVSSHLHDNDGEWDHHRNIGHGNVDWKHVVTLLNQAPRLKNIQSEVIPCREKESIADICSAFRKLEEL